MEAGAAYAWELVSAQVRDCRSDRRVQLYAIREDEMPGWMTQQHNFMNLNTRGIDAQRGARASLYRMDSVTGIDFIVQAVLVTQRATAYACLEACRAIENFDLDAYGIVCHGATHRSVAFCILMAALVYHNAEVMLTTRRTMRAADERGL